MLCDVGCDFVMLSDDMNDKILSSIPFPDVYNSYNRFLALEAQKLFDIASKARIKGFDPSFRVETELTMDLADRVERLLNISLAKRLRELLSSHRTELAAITIAEEVALGKFGHYEKEEAIEKGVRAGLAVVTDGVTVAPLQGVSSVKIKKNEDGSSYVAVSFAGPIRSAGGTEAAFTLVIADKLRIALGLDRYRPNAWGDDEVGRLVEELRIYEREVGNFQYKVSDEDVKKAIINLPVEIDGVETDPVEVVVHRGLKRIETDRVRGGALRVLNDGLIGRSRKLMKLLNELSIVGWEWLAELKSGQQQEIDETRAESSHFKEVISGRPVLSQPKMAGGFRLRYGRCYNTGLMTVGIHPSTSAIVDYSVVVGTQVKLDVPGKAATVAFVDTIEPPVVKLKDGSVMNVEDLKMAESIRNEVDKVLFLGDMLVSYGDFLENNVRLVPSGYVEEWWCHDLKSSLDKYGSLAEACRILKMGLERLRSFLYDGLRVYPSVSEAIALSEKLGIPLHPKYLFYWDLLSPSEVLLLRQNISIASASPEECILALPFRQELKVILEKACVPHKVREDQILIVGPTAYAVMRTLGLHSGQLVAGEWSDTLSLLSLLSGIQIKKKSSIFVGVRVGRPEKAMPRMMKPPVHVLFPVGQQGGPMRDITKATSSHVVKVELINAFCDKCGLHITSLKCPRCGGTPRVEKRCLSCGKVMKNDLCTTCKLPTVPYRRIDYPIAKALEEAIARVGYKPEPPLKGVKGLTNPTRICEPLEKGILRRKFELSIFRDGTIRFDATNVPLTHFKPHHIGTSVKKLRQLGYEKDVEGKELESEDQLLELFVQDVILPSEAGDYLLNVARFIDELLVRLYGLEPYYNANSKEDLVGHLVVGLAPHTSVGVLGRIIGFTQSQVCYAHPYWHSAKRRDCDGDEDAIMLLLDVFLNFSKEFLPGQIGGLMDAPLLLQLLVIPKEVQRQAHNIDVTKSYPLEFYQATLKASMPQDVAELIDTVRSRLGDERQFRNLGYTHDTNTLFVGRARNLYSTIKSIPEKVEKQLDLATKLVAVNPDEVASSVLKTHLLPDIVGNLNAYTSQLFRCKSCGARYRRIPLMGVCLGCGGELQPTVTRGSVEKYIGLAKKLCKRFKVDPYVQRRLELISEELSSLFTKEKTSLQLDLSSFIEEDG